VRRSPQRGLRPLTAGLIAIVLIAIFTYFVFSKNNPFSSPYQLKAVFSNTANISERAPVRIAGVEVGQVTGIQPVEDGDGHDTTTAVVTMEIQGRGLPIHKDATVRIRPRIFLEGNFFLDLEPGTPQSPDLGSGSTLPVSQTSTAVQIDQVLTTLQSDTRTNLRKLLAGYGDALNGKPLPGEDATQDPAARGLTAGQALNKSLDYSADALRGTAVVNGAFLGTDPHDLSKLVAGTQKVSAALNANEQQLQDLITNFNTTMAAFASEQGNLRDTIRLLPKVLGQANPTFVNLNKSHAPTQAFARELIPGVKETPATINASYPWIAQVRKLVSPGELQGLVADLRPSIRNLASTTDQSLKLLPQFDLLARCTSQVIVPTGDKPIQDRFSTGLPNYQEFWQTMVGLSGESQNFDGNGPYTRFQAGGGSNPVATGRVTGTAIDSLHGNAIRPILGVQPVMPAKQPPIRTDVPCYKNGVPNLSASIGAGP
jgi:ABC-type transporter Mla subunit MlaD